MNETLEDSTGRVWLAPATWEAPEILLAWGLCRTWVLAAAATNVDPYPALDRLLLAYNAIRGRHT